MKMTFDEYDALCEKLRNVENDRKDWLPSEKELIEFVEKDPEKYLDFLIWLSETTNPPKEERGQASLKAITKLLRDNIELE